MSTICGKVIAEPRTYTCFWLQRRYRVKFGDVITAVAYLVVITILLDALLMEVLLPMISTGDVAYILSILVASLIVGYMFASKIQEESKIRTIGSIVVLFTVLVAFFAMALYANPLANPEIQDSINSIHSTIGWTHYDWFVAIFGVVALNAVIALVLGLIGLYVGSMRKPSK
jgi:hypothetical protein